MATWRRSRLDLSMDTRVYLGNVIPTITLSAQSDTGVLRVGLWAGSTRVAGWYIPSIPASTLFMIRDGQAFALVDGEPQSVPVFVKDWDGVHWPQRRQQFPPGRMTLTLDQEPDKVVPVVVDVKAEGVE